MTRSRANYDELKTWFLGNYFDSCRDRGTRLKWSRRKIISDIHSDFLSSFDSQIEILMVNVIALVLTSGWDEEEESYYREKLCASLKSLGRQNYRDGLADEEQDELERDLEVLGFDNEE